MASEPIRDPAKDHLLTPKNSALIIIDYQPVQVSSIASMDRQLLINNIVGVAKIGLTYGLPIIHSTVNVKTGLNKPPIPQLRKVLKDIPTYDRTSINSWEDVEFVKAVKATGRKKLIMTALWTEAWTYSATSQYTAPSRRIRRISTIRWRFWSLVAFMSAHQVVDPRGVEVV